MYQTHCSLRTLTLRTSRPNNCVHLLSSVQLDHVVSPQVLLTTNVVSREGPEGRALAFVKYSDLSNDGIKSGEITLSWWAH